MIQGSFGSEGQLFFELDLITTDGLNLAVDAMLDTGFTKFWQLILKIWMDWIGFFLVMNLYKQHKVNQGLISI